MIHEQKTLLGNPKQLARLSYLTKTLRASLLANMSILATNDRCTLYAVGRSGSSYVLSSGTDVSGHLNPLIVLRGMPSSE